MRKSYLYLIFFFLNLSAPMAQVRLMGLSEDQSRSEIISSHNNFRTTVATFSDTLALPFFDDFSSPDIKLDSILLVNGGSVRIFSHYLNNLPDTTQLVITGVKNSSNPLVKKINRSWYITRIDSFQYSLDSSKVLATPFAINKDSVIKSAYFRIPGKNNFTSPSTSRWLAGGGTYINNRFPKSPPSYNVATFDGLASNGIPYNTININTNGITDNLTSLPIRLTNYTVADSLYLSFYWQTCGFGEVPDPGDSIYVEFLDASGTWIPVWGVQGDGSTPTNIFQMAFIRISDPVYFHKGFKFRFLSYGRQSGVFDVWNIDYIYLNKGRTASDVHSFDWTIGDASTSFLKNYTSMPYGQFFSDSSNQITNLTYSINNLDSGVGGLYNGVCKLTDNVVSGIVAADSITINDPMVVTTTHSFRPKIVGYANNGQPRRITHTFSVGQVDKDSTFFAENNKYYTATVLWDYFSYDDGTPEASVASNLFGSKFGNQYLTLQTDTLTDIDIYFTRTTGPNMVGRTILLSVWDENFNLLTSPQQPISVGQPNTFTRYHLNSPIIITAGKNFYVGYQQNFNDLLTVGYDRNNDRASKLFINDSGGNTWGSFDARPGYITGALMIRAVFSKGQILLGTVQEQKKKEFVCELYPNPAEDIINIIGDVNKVIVYDLLGKEIFKKDFDGAEAEKNINLFGNRSGIYLVYLFNESSSIVKKVILK